MVLLQKKLDRRFTAQRRRPRSLLAGCSREVLAISSQEADRSQVSRLLSQHERRPSMRPMRSHFERQELGIYALRFVAVTEGTSNKDLVSEAIVLL
jgi:hypothetical protein